MGIERGGNSEYEEYEPSFEEKTAKWEETLQSLLAEDPSLLKLSGKFKNYKHFLKIKISHIKKIKIGIKEPKKKGCIPVPIAAKIPILVTYLFV